MSAQFKPRLNTMLAEKVIRSGEDIPYHIIKRLTQDGLAIDDKVPFVYIKNIYEAQQGLKKTPFWLAHGGARTGSTFTFAILKTLMESITSKYIAAWERDYSSPAKFFEMVECAECVDSGILKIHRYEDSCAEALSLGKAKAVITTRDYPSVAASWLRMRKNKNSPIYSENTSPQDMLNFIKNEIMEEKRKRTLPNSIFVKESLIRDSPRLAVKMIIDHLGLESTETSIEAVGVAFNVEKMRDRQTRIEKGSSGHDKSYFLHVGHVNEKVADDPEIRNLVFQEFSSLLDEHGYLLL